MSSDFARFSVGELWCAVFESGYDGEIIFLGKNGSWKKNGRDKQTDSRQQRNNPWLPPPRRVHKAQEMPQIAQQKCRRENFESKLKNQNSPTNLSPDDAPPPPVQSVPHLRGGRRAISGAWRAFWSNGRTPVAEGTFSVQGARKVPAVAE